MGIADGGELLQTAYGAISHMYTKLFTVPPNLKFAILILIIPIFTLYSKSVTLGPDLANLLCSSRPCWMCVLITWSPEHLSISA